MPSLATARLNERPARRFAGPRLAQAALCALLWTVLAAGCGNIEEEDRAEALRQEVIDQDYTAWSSPAPYGTRQPSDTLHLDEVRIYFDASVAGLHQSTTACAQYAADNPQLSPSAPFTLDAGVAEWPDGATLVKEGYSGGDLGILAIMRKEQGEWFFAEFDGDGELLFSGRPDVCTGCHAGAMHDATFSAHLTTLCPPPSEL